MDSLNILLSIAEKFLPNDKIAEFKKLTNNGKKNPYEVFREMGVTQNDIEKAKDKILRHADSGKGSMIANLVCSALGISKDDAIKSVKSFTVNNTSSTNNLSSIASKLKKK